MLVTLIQPTELRKSMKTNPAASLVSYEIIEFFTAIACSFHFIRDRCSSRFLLNTKCHVESCLDRSIDFESDFLEDEIALNILCTDSLDI